LSYPGEEEEGEGGRRRGGQRKRAGGWWEGEGGGTFVKVIFCMVNPVDCGDGGKISFWLVQLHASTFLAVVDLDFDDAFFFFFFFFFFSLMLGGEGRSG